MQNRFCRNIQSEEVKIFRLLTDPIHRSVLQELNEAARELGVRELANRIILDDSIPRSSSDYEAEFEQLILRLHHDHLPRLDEAGLIEYDLNDHIVAYGNHTGFDAEWADIDILEGLVSRFRGGESFGDSDIGLLEGSQAVYDHSRAMADEAESELFLMYGCDELLDEACLHTLKTRLNAELRSTRGRKATKLANFFGNVCQRQRSGSPRWTGCIQIRNFQRSVG